MNAVLIPFFMTVTIGIFLAIWTGLVASAMMEFRSVMNRAQDFMSDCAGHVRYHSDFPYPIIIPRPFEQAKVIAFKWKVCAQLDHLGQEDAAEAFAKEFDAYFDAYRDFLDRFEAIGRNYEHEDYPRLTKLYYQGGLHLLYVGDITPDLGSILQRELGIMFRSICTNEKQRYYRKQKPPIV